jgi:pimeloyl-ACP methyl ester carboxylesterase
MTDPVTPPTPPTTEPVARVGDNTLDTATIPIVFVPGVMGSRLHFTSIDESWDPDSNWAMIHWVRISAERCRQEFALSNPAEVMNDNDDLTAAQRDRGWAGVAWDFYGQFVRDLAAQRFSRYRTPVYVIGYDWRQNNRDSGNAVASRIRGILASEGAERFILISHSMGGLVTRSCLKNHSDIADKLMGVVHIAQPVNGGVVLVRRMFTGAISSVDGGTGLSTILGDTRPKFQTIMSALPGPMQLLVTPNYRDTNGSWWYDYVTFEHPNVTHRWEGNSWDLYLQPASPPGLLAPAGESYAITGAVRTEFVRRIGEARSFHDGLGLWKHERTWAINSTGQTVDMRVHFQLPPLRVEVQILPGDGFGGGSVLYYGTRADGSTAYVDSPNPANRGNIMRRRNESDGTVPISSAEGLFPGQHHGVGTTGDYNQLRQFRISGATHDAICHHRDCERRLFDIMRHILGIRS